MEEDDEDIFSYFFATLIRREREPSTRIFFEEVLPDFSSLDFSKHFGLTFSRLFHDIEPYIAKDVRTQGKQPILTEKRAWWVCGIYVTPLQ